MIFRLYIVYNKHKMIKSGYIYKRLEIYLFHKIALGISFLIEDQFLAELSQELK